MPGPHAVELADHTDVCHAKQCGTVHVRCVVCGVPHAEGSATILFVVSLQVIVRV